MAASGSWPYSFAADPNPRARHGRAAHSRESGLGCFQCPRIPTRRPGAGLLVFFAFPGPTKEPMNNEHHWTVHRGVSAPEENRSIFPCEPPEEALVLGVSESSRIRLHRTRDRRGLLDVIAIGLSAKSRREDQEHAGRAASGRTSSDQPEMRTTLGVPAGEHRESHASCGHHPNFSMHSRGLGAIEYCASSSSADFGDSDFVHCRVRSRREAGEVVGRMQP
jgi:hypothetical protein